MNDHQISGAARQALTRLRIDTNTIVIRSSRSVLSGRLQYKFATEGHSPELGYELLRELDRQLNRMEGVTRVEYSFDNWAHHSEGHWTKKTPRKQLGARRASSAPEPEQ
jgi:hypothetical protein